MIQGRGDRKHAASGGCRALPKKHGSGGARASQSHGGDVLQVARGARGKEVDVAIRLKTLERENASLKGLLADAELDKAILR